MFTVSRKDGQGPSENVEAVDLMSTCERLSENGKHPLDIKPATSDFGTGKQVVSSEAKARIEATHEALKAAGVDVDTSEQLYATGTRMAQVGYDTQAQRKIDHEAMPFVKDAAGKLMATVKAEDRHDKNVCAGEIAKSLHVNGSITVLGGYALSEQAIRGLCARTEFPALGYILGLRERIIARAAAVKAGEAGQDVVRAANAEDNRTIAAVLKRECENASGEVMKLRMRAHGRNGKPDIFAAVSPDYAPADAPEALAQIVDALPNDARGVAIYDATSTSWELRADVWTKTPVAEQAVGEAFKGYASFFSRDNGTGRFRGGGGIELLRCLNASTYTASGTATSRVHRGRIMYDIHTMLRGAISAIDALCTAWGRNRAETLTVPEREGKPVTIEDAIPGFYAYMLRDRRSELLGVLPGRSSAHVEGLTKAFWGERRDETKLVRSDLAQGWTRYAQDFGTDTRREAESKIGDWLVNARPIGCALDLV